jgi:hypothetical protein
MGRWLKKEKKRNREIKHYAMKTHGEWMKR